MVINPSKENTHEMTPFFSEKMKVVSFLSIIIVLYIHTGFPAEVMADKPIAAVAQKIMTGLLGPCAVPMFYVISGYLFFHGVNHVQRVFVKMKKRIRTLFLPFVIAALAYPLGPILKELVFNLPAEKQYMVLIHEQGFVNTLKCLFYDCGTTMPWAYHLWFMRDLIIIVAFSPIIFYLRRWICHWSIVVVLVLYYLFPQLYFLYALFWFVAGSFVLDKLVRLPQRLTFLMLVIFLLMASWRLFGTCEARGQLKIVEISLGVVSLWCLYDIIVPKSFHLGSMPLLHIACQSTFFLYLYHEPSLHAITKGISQVLGNNEFGYTISIMISPLLLSPVLIAIAYLVKKYMPSVYAIVSGGR